MTIAEYAELHGISERTVRRRIQRGHLRAIMVAGPYGPEYQIVEGASPGNGAADEPPLTSRPPSPAADETDSLDTSGAWPDTLDSFLALVRDQQQTIMELSGRCGWLQAQLEAATTRIRELEAPKAAPAESTDQAESETTNHPAPSTNGPNSGVRKTSTGPWWQFWRHLGLSGR